MPEPNPQREFQCVHCSGRIEIPIDLPPTTGPCPYCGEEITSPALDTDPPRALATPPLSAPQAPQAPPVAPGPVPMPDADEFAADFDDLPQFPEEPEFRPSALIPIILVVVLLILCAGVAWLLIHKTQRGTPDGPKDQSSLNASPSGERFLRPGGMVRFPAPG
ncbi:MAG: hypothetical protein NTW21_31500 [Verrucomicrobia bacterium]|nr:hypothetical protein [Verrucomicrobiota bacterium]